MAATVGLPRACSSVMAVDTSVDWMGVIRPGFTCIDSVILTATKPLHGLVPASIK